MKVHVLEKCVATLISCSQDQERTWSKYLLWCEDTLWDSLCKFRLVLWRSHSCQTTDRDTCDFPHCGDFWTGI